MTRPNSLVLSGRALCVASLAVLGCAASDAPKPPLAPARAAAAPVVDPDPDRDRIAGDRDKCPTEAETYNGFEDEDGCADRGKVIVESIVEYLPERAHFRRGSAAIPREDYRILDRIAATLGQNPDIGVVEIQGHCDPSEAAALGEARARAAYRYLLGKGVAPARFVVRGYGASRPLRSNRTAADRAANRRLEFVIISRAPAP
jgi:outer membrane protein OmpA-like peptidoglycan-associated protein